MNGPKPNIFTALEPTEVDRAALLDWLSTFSRVEIDRLEATNTLSCSVHQVTEVYSFQSMSPSDFNTLLDKIRLQKMLTEERDEMPFCHYHGKPPKNLPLFSIYKHSDWMSFWLDYLATGPLGTISGRMSATAPNVSPTLHKVAKWTR